MIKPVIMTNKPVNIKMEGIRFSPWNQRPVESLRKHADGMMKIRGVALRTPWTIQEDTTSKHNKLMHNNGNQHWLSWCDLRSAPRQLPDSQRPKTSMCKLQLWATLCPHVQLLKDPYSTGHWTPPTKINKNRKMSWSYCTHIWMCALSANRKKCFTLVLVYFVTKPQKFKISKYHFPSHTYTVYFSCWCMRRYHLPLV